MYLLPVRVYYEDTDSGGVVYYANYLKFMERARTEWLRTLGVEQDQLINEKNILFAVRNVAMDFIKPAKFNDLLYVTASIKKRGGASITFAQKVVRHKQSLDNEAVTVEMLNNKDTTELCSGTIKIACLDAITMQPARIPKELQRNMEINCGG